MNNLFITDKRMLRLKDYAIDKGLVKNDSEFFERIKFARNSLPKVLQGIQGFTKEQILNACKLTGASADYVFGFTSELKRKPGRNVIERLKEIVVELESK